MSIRLCCPCAVVQATGYHWPELPQVSFLLRQTFGHPKNVFVATDTCLSRQTLVCRDKRCLLSQQKYACHNKCFVATKVCLSRQMFCRDKKIVVTKHVFCDDKSILLRQKFCHGNHTFVVTNFCHNKNTCGSSHQ